MLHEFVKLIFSLSSKCSWEFSHLTACSLSLPTASSFRLIPFPGITCFPPLFFSFLAVPGIKPRDSHREDRCSLTEHIWQCSGLASDSGLRDHSRQGSGDHTGAGDQSQVSHVQGKHLIHSPIFPALTFLHLYRKVITRLGDQSDSFFLFVCLVAKSSSAQGNSLHCA